MSNLQSNGVSHENEDSTIEDIDPLSKQRVDRMVRRMAGKLS